MYRRLPRHSCLRNVLPVFIAILVCLVSIPALSCVSSSAANGGIVRESPPSVENLIKLGLSGKITAPLTTGRLTEDGDNLVFAGTSDGLYIISSGTLVRYIYTPFGVSHISLIEDVSGNGWRDIVISLHRADAPGLHCYDGLTGEKLWQLAPRQRVYVQDVGWSDLQLAANDVAVVNQHQGQIIVVSTGRYAFGIDARTGGGLWNFQSPHDLSALAVVGDIDGDGVDDIAVGSGGGNLYLLSGRTGKVKWETMGAGRYMPTFGPSVQSAVTSLAAYGSDTGKVVAGGDDGRVRLINLLHRSTEWVADLVTDADSLPAQVLVTATPDVAGTPGILAAAQPTRGKLHSQAVMLDGSSGDQLWQKGLESWPVTGFSLGFHVDRPVLLEPRPASRVNLVDLKDGAILKQIVAPTLDGQPVRAWQAGVDRYLAVSDGSDLVLVSSEGAIEWCYPRIGEVSVIEGGFTSAGSRDLLAYGRAPGGGVVAGKVRVMAIVDGLTLEEVWRYEMPHDEFYVGGGLSGVQAGGDLTGHGLTDIIAHRGATVFRFNGSTGSLTLLDAGKDIRHLDTMQTGPDDWAMVCGTEDEILVIDGAGGVLWRSDYSSWGDMPGGEVRVIGDLNGDGVDDLAVIFPDRMVIAAGRTAGGLDFVKMHTILPRDGAFMVFKEITGDLNGDGAAGIALHEYDQQAHPPGGRADYTALVIASPVDGTTLWRLPMSRQASFDLACADFTGDGYLDSLVFWEERVIASPYSVQGARLEVYSGATGASIWHLQFPAGQQHYRPPVDGRIEPWKPEPSNGPAPLPAAAVPSLGDDGRYHLAVTEIVHGSGERIVLYDVTANQPVRQVGIPAGERERSSYWLVDGGRGIHISNGMEGSSPGSGMSYLGGISAEGQLVAASARLVAGTVRMDDGLGFFDISGERLAGVFPFTATDSFGTGGENTVGVAALGGVFNLRLAVEEPGLKIISPAAGAAAGSPVRVAWEGNAGFADVFVDGVKYAMTAGSEVRLSLPAGQQEVLVRHMDGEGRTTYAVVYLQVRQLPLAMIAGLIVLAGLVAACLYPAWMRNRRNRRAQEGMDGG